jgi:hypothetical protein
LNTAAAISSRAVLELEVLITTSKIESSNGFFSKGSVIKTVSGLAGNSKGFMFEFVMMTTFFLQIQS